MFVEIGSPESNHVELDMTFILIMTGSVPSRRNVGTGHRGLIFSDTLTVRPDTVQVGTSTCTVTFANPFSFLTNKLNNV